MSKVLIDRELLSVASLHLEYSGYTETGKKLRALLDTPSGTPAMPVKAYYHEWTDLEGVRTRSVGLEVRKEFADAPLVLESDALARIACLEGEIAKRDARIAGLEAELVEARKCAEIMQQSAFAYQAELSAIKAQEPAFMWHKGATEDESEVVDVDCACPCCVPLYAAPVSEAKAQGVVQWPDADEIMQMAFEEGQPADDASGYCFELEEFDLFIERLMSEVALLNAAPVQQVSVPDEMRSLAQRLREYNQNPHHINPMSEAFHILVADAANALSTACVPKEIAAAITWSEHLLFECGALTSTRAPSVHVYNKTFAAVNEARAMLAAAPAAPAADAHSWRRKEGVNGIKQFMTQKCYDAQTDAIKRHYEPFKCANCKAADAGLVEALELAANRLDRLALEQGEFWRGYATAWADEARATANGVKS